MHEKASRLWQQEVPGGQHWSGVLRRNTRLQMTAKGPTANVAMLIFSQEDKIERYNMADTLKAQHTAFLTSGHVLLSDMGRVMAAITRDDIGGHETFCGVTDARDVAKRYGETSFEEERNMRLLSGREGLLIELARWGLGVADLVANINWFSLVDVDNEGRLDFKTRDVSGRSIDLHFEMDTLVVCATAPHPLCEQPEYASAPVMLTVDRVEADASAFCREYCAENRRAYDNTYAYLGIEGAI